MAWLYKRGDSKNWWIGWRANGKQYLRSTKTSDPKKAAVKLKEFELLEMAHHSDKLTDDFVKSLKHNLTPAKGEKK